MSGGYGGGATGGKAGAAWYLFFNAGGDATFLLNLPDGWTNFLLQMIGSPMTVPDTNSPPRIYAPFFDGVLMELFATVGPGMAGLWYSGAPHAPPKGAGVHTMVLKASDDGGTTWFDADTDTAGSPQYVMFATVGEVILQPGT